MATNISREPEPALISNQGGNLHRLCWRYSLASGQNIGTFQSSLKSHSFQGRFPYFLKLSFANLIHILYILQITVGYWLLLLGLERRLPSPARNPLLAWTPPTLTDLSHYLNHTKPPFVISLSAPLLSSQLRRPEIRDNSNQKPPFWQKPRVSATIGRNLPAIS